MAMANYKDIFKIKHNNRLPEKGKLLIAEPFLREVFFHRSVILLTEHNDNSSMGFVLNKKTNLWLNDYFDGLEQVEPIPLYLGGPVSPERLFFIHTLRDVVQDSEELGNNLYFSVDFERIKHYLRNDQPIDGKVKFFIGYAGWTKNQLMGEIKQDSWLVGQAPADRIMHADGDSFWKYAVKLIGGRYLTWLNYPKDPQLN
jgi:putative transcriptional regulator